MASAVLRTLATWYRRVKNPRPTEKVNSLITGQKRAVQASPDRENKRRRLEEKTMELNSTENRKDEEMRRCGVILDKLMKDKCGWFFNKPLDAVALGIRDYHKNVKRPMDLGTVKLKLDMGGYENSLDFAKDVRLTFYNAMFCYQTGYGVHTMATVLLDMFEKLFDPTYEKFEAERRTLIAEQQKFCKPLQRKASANASTRMHPQEFVQETVFEEQIRTVPETKEMSRQERDQLGPVLQDLAGEYLEEILQILAKRNYTPAADGEIELDVQAVDNETMWDLHTFVMLKLKAERNKENPRLSREMSDWERYQLGLVMHECACEYIAEILQIVDKRNANITTSDGDGKINLAIQALDSEIMWDLHRSVMLTLKAEQNKENARMTREMSYGGKVPVGDDCARIC